MQTHVGKYSIVAIDFGRPDQFAVDWNQTGALFARGFGYQLFKPRAKIGNSRRSKDSDLIAPVFLQRAENRSQDRAGILICGHDRRARVYHLFDAIEKLRKIHALHCPWNHPEVGKRRVTSSNARHSEKDVAKTVGFRNFLEVRARVGDRDEALPCRFRSDGLLHLVVEILLEDIRLEGAARFARDDEDRFRHVELLRECANLSRVGGIKDENLRIPVDLSVGEFHHFNAQTRTAHAEQNRMGETGLANLVGDLFEIAAVRNVVVGNREPAEPVGFVLICPKRGIASPQTLHFLICLPIFERRFHGSREILR